VWTRWVSAVFVKTYLHFTSQATFVPRTREECQLLLDAYVLEKAIYELGYELNNRPDWVTIPLHGITQLMEGAG